MIFLYHGVPGSGKSLYACRQLYRHALRRKHVICNYSVAVDTLPEKQRYIADYIHSFVQSDITPPLLMELASSLLPTVREGELLLIIDEAEIPFNSRQDKGRLSLQERLEWISFFSQHRKIGFDIILICPFKGSLDKQILGCVEILSEFRGIKSSRPALLSWIPMPPLFSWRWLYRGSWGKSNIIKRGVFSYSARIGRLYNTFARFDKQEAISDGSGKSSYD